MPAKNAEKEAKTSKGNFFTIVQRQRSKIKMERKSLCIFLVIKRKCQPGVFLFCFHFCFQRNHVLFLPNGNKFVRKPIHTFIVSRAECAAKLAEREKFAYFPLN